MDCKRRPHPASREAASLLDGYLLNDSTARYTTVVSDVIVQPSLALAVDIAQVTIPSWILVSQVSAESTCKHT